MTKEQHLSEIGTEQWGLVTTAQARRVGITSQAMAKMARAGDLVRLAHGVYRLAGSPIDIHEDLRVAWLGLDPGRTAVERLADEDVDIVSHRSAALLLGLGDLDADVMEFTVPRRRQTRRTDVRLHRSAVGADDWALTAGIPTATPRRVIADLAAARIDRGHLATVVRDAVLKHDLAMDTIATTLAPHARGYGAATGDGQGLVTLLLREAGVPRSVVDIVARGAPDVPAMQLLRYAAEAAETDPDTTRWVVSSLGQSDALRSLAVGLDPEVLRKIAGGLNPEVLRSFRVGLDPEILRAATPAMEAMRRAAAASFAPPALPGVRGGSAPRGTAMQHSAADGKDGVDERDNDG